MNTEYLNALREQFGFQAWAENQDPPAERLSVWRFAFTGTELGGLRLQRTDRVQPPPDAGPPGVLATVHALWDGAEGEMLRLDTYECTSGRQARETLLRVLGQHQGAGSLARAQDGAGEVAFEGPNGYTRIFSRGNLVVEVRNASRRLVPVAGHAQRMDKLLLARPDLGTAEQLGMRSAVIHPEELEALAARSDAAFREDGPAAKVWFKFFASGGEVVLEGGRPVFRADAGPAAAQPGITVYTVGLPRSEPGTDAFSIFLAR
jgi:hypothetical protein